MTLWAYVIAFDEGVSQQALISALDAEPAIKNWYACMSHTVFVVSDQSASGVSEIVRKHIGNHRFIVLDVQTDRQGWLPPKVWQWLKNPQASE